jgi:hypothetical protein
MVEFRQGELFGLLLFRLVLVVYVGGNSVSPSLELLAAFSSDEHDALGIDLDTLHFTPLHDVQVVDRAAVFVFEPVRIVGLLARVDQTCSLLSEVVDDRLSPFFLRILRWVPNVEAASILLLLHNSSSLFQVLHLVLTR